MQDMQPSWRTCCRSWERGKPRKMEMPKKSAASPQRGFRQFMNLTDLGVCVCVRKWCIYNRKWQLFRENCEQPSDQPSEYGSTEPMTKAILFLTLDMTQWQWGHSSIFNGTATKSSLIAGFSPSQKTPHLYIYISKKTYIYIIATCQLSWDHNHHPKPEQKHWIIWLHHQNISQHAIIIPWIWLKTIKIGSFPETVMSQPVHRSESWRHPQRVGS